MNTDQKDTGGLPIRSNLTLAYIISLVIAALMTIASLAGLLYQTVIYPTDELVQSFVPNDVVNLLIGLPTLLGAMWLTRRGRLIGLLLWPGALFYVFYTYIIYTYSMPLNAGLLMHLALVLLSTYSMIGLVSSIDGKAVQNRLSGAVPEKAGGGVLVGLGVLFLIRVISVLVNAIINQTPLAATELALNISDFLITPTWIIGGVLLWRRNTPGYVFGLGLLFQASMAFVGLIFVLILRPLITTAQFSLSDVLIVIVMGMICFVPFGLFIRGAASDRAPSSV